MRDAQGRLVLGKTRWRRFALSFGICISMVLTTLVLMATGVIALPITVSGTQFTVTADSLTGTSFTQFGAVDPVSGGSPKAVAVTLLSEGTLTNMTQVVCGPTGLPGGLANLKVTLTADSAHATGGLVVDATSLSGDATFSNIQIGVPVSSDRAGASPVTTFGQTADTVSINNLDQKAVYTRAGTFVLTGLHLSAAFTGTC